ncbi:unnamed protein product [Urochloa humidicola]
MALGAEMARPFPAAVGGDDEASVPARPAAFLAAETTGRPVDPVIWSDEKQMKRELVAWAKAVAAAKNAASSSSRAPRHRRRVRP